MSKESAALLSRDAQLRLRSLDDQLQPVYGAREATLENKRRPLDEAIYIVLSFQTDVERLKLVWRSLKAAFPTWGSLANAAEADIADVIRIGGLQFQKARTLKRLLHHVHVEYGSYSLRSLEHLADSEAEGALLRLPGLSWKGARCILLYSLNRDVFPIDVNAFRILKRYGVLHLADKYRRRGLHDALQTIVPPTRRRGLHVNLLLHGQTTCLPRTPHCHECPVSTTCLRNEARLTSTSGVRT